MRGLHVLFLRGAKRLLTAGPAGGANDGPLRPRSGHQILERLGHLLLQRPEHPDALTHGGLSLLMHQPEKDQLVESGDACPLPRPPALVQSPARLSHFKSSEYHIICDQQQGTGSGSCKNQRICVS